jgi:hypothetical protein
MRRFRTVLVGCAIGLAVPASASAATLVVQGTADDAGSPSGCTAASSAGTYNCTTIRDAVDFANTSPDAGTNPTIKLNAGEFNLTHGALSPGVPVTIIGAGDQGSSVTTIKQTSTDADGIDTDFALTLNDLVVSGTPGPSTGYVDSGGIYDSGADPVTLNGVTVTGCTVQEPAAASATGSSPGATGNEAFAAAIDAGGTLTLTESVVSDNRDVAGNGGAGSATEGPGAGGGAGGPISANALVISDSVVKDNVAIGGDGGAAAAAGQTGGTGGQATGGGVNDATPVTITSSMISDNQALGGNGGAADGSGGGGTAGAALGGGLYLANGSGAGSITDTTISGNTAEAGTPASDTASGGFGGNASYAGGGGMFATLPFSLSISSSTFSGNQSIVQNAGTGAGTETGFAGSAEGGALYVNQGPDATVVNSTMSGNTAQSGAGGGTAGTIGSFGGAIDAYGGGSTAVGLYSDTIAGNAATASHGATAELGANLIAIATPLTLQDTVIANAEPSGAPNCAFQGGGAITDDGHNLWDGNPDVCGFSFTENDQRVISAGLNPLGSNGGPSIIASGSTPAIPEAQTLAPAVGSPVIGFGGACTNPLAEGATTPPFPALTVDERGRPRPATCDIGAFQTQPLKASGTAVIKGRPIVGATLGCDGTFTATGDGAFTSTGSIGTIKFTFLWSSNGTKLGTNSGLTITDKDQGDGIVCTETATGAYGQASSTSAAVHVPPAITLTKVAESHKTWAEKHFKHGPAVGTTFSYTLNLSATVVLKFTQQAKGRKLKGKCVAQTHKNAHKPSCKLTVKAGALRTTGLPGKNKLKFAGKLGGKKLAPGSYEVTITAETGPGDAGKTLRFTIAR